jgi:hypothetical protein
MLRREDDDGWVPHFVRSIPELHSFVGSFSNLGIALIMGRRE